MSHIDQPASHAPTALARPPRTVIAKPLPRRRRKLGKLLEDASIDYKNVALLKQFITDRGKILPRRVTGATAKQQRKLTIAIKRARAIALLPYQIG
jgi:small subunit ribosomal protein S18